MTLEDLDDVQHVYSNFDMDAKDMEAVSQADPHLNLQLATGPPDSGGLFL